MYVSILAFCQVLLNEHDDDDDDDEIERQVLHTIMSKCANHPLSGIKDHHIRNGIHLLN